MSEFSDIVRRYGFRMTGEDLMEFCKDLDAFLDDPELFGSLEVFQTYEPDCMVIASCQIQSGVSIDRAKERVQEIWEDKLRFPGFAKHSIEDVPGGFIFHFVTLSEQLAVVGRIECSKVNEWQHFPAES
jgi:hypothetical protein